ncbi:hypothetical protein NEPAR06_0907 [Nematocida parisii]|uniref:Uncharacterized protein n=1 Tax=Nematocida parisii (strain ERTm3) TaxID=935791 RepID=I3EDU1_NEMP3|nr:hypothetical protein NEQG_02511 [Nematocida parisii ERTm3]KAI5127556.1 hypothetical protein NEPAR08_0926 [Nematocida parisii]KAI5127831.1 hypothetical protein NEPAR03_1111 [Nematocida parisii]KAI5141653.1 hypothetical protein NEPAR04_1130 [Nematocida parisii]KAI5145506.1 hypothetical protein NEPAR07_1736 [Nematocida parisii]
MQTQTQTARPKTLKKSIYSGLGGAAVVALVAYVACTIYFKFFAVDSASMGTLFYSWRTGGADDAALKEKMDKFNAIKGQEQMKKLLESYVNDSYPIHLPRLMANHLTFAYPNMDLFLGLRKSFVDAEKKIINEEEDAKNISKYNKLVTPVMFYSTKFWEETANHVEDTFNSYYNSLSSGVQKKILMDATVKMIDLVVDLFEDDGFKYTGITPSKKAVSALSDLIYTVIESNHVGDTGFAEHIEDNKDAKRFLKKQGLDGIKDKKEFSNQLANRFFTEITSGVLYPYFSYGYSTVLNTIVYLCLDLKGLEYNETLELEVDEDIRPLAEAQKRAEAKITAIGSAIAYGMGTNLSEKVGINAVKNSTNIIVFSLFTSRTVDPSEADSRNLNKILEHLKDKKNIIDAI